MLCTSLVLFVHPLNFAQSQDPSPDTVRSSSYLSKVHQGDLIDIHVKGFVDYDWRGRLNPEGYLDGFNKITDSIYARCRSVDEVAVDINRSLSSILRDPQTEVRIVDTTKRPYATIDGAIKTPQRFQIRRQVRLNELIVQSGGLTDRSSGEILVSRPNGLSCFEQPEKPASNMTRVRIADLLAGDPASNPVIVSGDLVVVTEALPVYLLGAVETQGKMDYRSELTVSRAIDSAGGISKKAIPERINIYRRNSAIVPVDLVKIRKNELDDVKLMPFDIIDVPFKGRPPKRLPPVIEDLESESERRSKLPVKIIE